MEKFWKGQYPSLEEIQARHTADELEAFYDFMCGQTAPILDSGESGVYSWDYERWLSQGKRNHQLSGDWD